MIRPNRIHSTNAALRRNRAQRGRIASRLARSSAARAMAGAHRRSDTDALAIVCSPAAVHRGYRITIVLDRLDVREHWSGKALIASSTSPARWLACLDAHNLSRRHGGLRARAAMLRRAMRKIDEVEAASHGVWPAVADPA
ncbi:hypothetical protein [Lysobacter auxotrophicus]|uniref:Uncharacterized protein n=1 Tax=Lysobacter auxotrophicus TaxID=2992573 RepID=A0ABN6UJJ7_9GAMM|nr:hypothetical protein [Lysobacter auxotrophicus]BDU16396.1 hypothetical protein LA521A_15970 [Lysobacter auxotrophicus]